MFKKKWKMQLGFARTVVFTMYAVICTGGSIGDLLFGLYSY